MHDLSPYSSLNTSQKIEVLVKVRLKSDPEASHTGAMASSCYLYFDVDGPKGPDDQEKMERVLAAISKPVSVVSFASQAFFRHKF